MKRRSVESSNLASIGYDAANEIHFNNEYQEKGKKLSNEMYNQIINCK
ncbi:MAG: hypothetical protein JJE44_11345 [Flavobacteriaceae bacterium]|nr:hypothetical protein [Flavobacteriaceae bacterium]